MISTYAMEEVEQLRKKSRNFAKAKVIFRVLVILGLVAVYACAFYAMRSDNQIFMPVVILLWIALVVGMCIFNRIVVKHKEAFKTCYKNYFVKDVLCENLNQVEYIPDQGVTREWIKAAQLIQTANKISSEDYLRAEYNGIVFEQADVKSIWKRQKQSDVIQFKGRMLKFSCPDRQMSDMQIFTENFKYRASSVNGNPMAYGLLIPAGFNKRGVTQTQDQDFDKAFDVYAVNESEALRMLAPSTRMTYLYLKDKYTSVAFRFVGNEVYVAMNSQRDTFECNDKHEIDYQSEELRIIDDIEEIKMLIDTLC